MKIKAIIFGSTGMLGQGLLRECLESSKVESVLIVNRNSNQQKHPKLKEIICKDLFDLSAYKNEFAQYDTCFYCIGISTVGLSEAEYTKITYDLTISIANTVIEANKDFTFIFISGGGANINSSMVWARVKAKAENALLAMPFQKAFVFRPGFIQPLHGIKSRTKMYNFFYAIFQPIYFILKNFKGLFTDTETLGKAMINVAITGNEKLIIESGEINGLGGI